MHFTYSVPRLPRAKRHGPSMDLGKTGYRREEFQDSRLNGGHKPRVGICGGVMVTGFIRVQDLATLEIQILPLNHD